MTFSGGKLQIALPFSDENPTIPNNERQAYSCARKLKQRLLRDSATLTEYSALMQRMIQNNHMERVPEGELAGQPGKTWFLIHHAVRHKVKGKLKVVFDYSRKCEGVSLNDMLLQGPDLLNKLAGVLLRFREHCVAFIGDIEQMFLQLKVPPEQADFMRVFWWSDGNMLSNPVQYHLTSHTFGAVSSPSVANFAVKQAAIWAAEHSIPVRDALARGAYMDGVLCSSPSLDEVRSILSVVLAAARTVLFNLRGLLSNSRELMLELPGQSVSENCRTIDLTVNR